MVARRVRVWRSAVVSARGALAIVPAGGGGAGGPHDPVPGGGLLVQRGRGDQAGRLVGQRQRRDDRERDLDDRGEGRRGAVVQRDERPGERRRLRVVAPDDGDDAGGVG